MFDTITNASSFLKIQQKASVVVEKEEGNREICKTREFTRRQAWVCICYLTFCDTVVSKLLLMLEKETL